MSTEPAKPAGCLTMLLGLLVFFILVGILVEVARYVNGHS